MLLVTSEGRGVPQSWKSVDIVKTAHVLHEQMIVAREQAFW